MRRRPRRDAIGRLCAHCDEWRVVSPPAGAGTTRHEDVAAAAIRAEKRAAPEEIRQSRSRSFFLLDVSRFHIAARNAEILWFDIFRVYPLFLFSRGAAFQNGGR